MNYTIKVTKDKIRIGDKFRVISSKKLNGWAKGEIVVAEQNSSTGTFVAKSLISDMPNSVQLGVHVERMGITVKELEDSINEYKKEIEDLENKLKFMKNKDIKELDERRYVRYMMLQEINKDSPIEEKEEVINEILEHSHGL